MKALTQKGYDVNYTWGMNLHGQKFGGAILPEMMRWLWRDGPVSTDPKDMVERSFRQAARVKFPKTEIANSQIHARLYLPDVDKGYYRATRFDWSGVISSLKWNGHEYFGQWFDRYDPKIHDSITGPVEEFLTKDSGLGYAEASPGGTFVRIGVGSLRKPVEPAFQRFATYEIVDPGKWSVRNGPDWVEFEQVLTDPSGYAYVYRKRVSLTSGKPELILQHSLRNTGRKAIESSVYDHNFFMLDGAPSSGDLTVTLPFEPRLTNEAGFGSMAAVQGKQIVYRKELARGEVVQSELQGFGTTARDYDIRVENRKTGAGVRQTSDRPISRFNFWSIRTTVCPEAYLDMKIQPGEEFTWRIAYEFYDVAAR